MSNEEVLFVLKEKSGSLVIAKPFQKRIVKVSFLTGSLVNTDCVTYFALVVSRKRYEYIFQY